MDDTEISTFMSYVLRHRPDAAGLVLDAAGWTTTDALLQGLQRSGKDVSRARLVEVVASNDKRRFEFNHDQSMIRASQGHSVPVELGYAPHAPPTLLYHGTVDRFLPSIFRQGLRKGQRRHVHLSADAAIAASVGTRRGAAVILQIRAQEMHVLGHMFFQSTNGVWLTESVPAAFIDRPVEQPFRDTCD